MDGQPLPFVLPVGSRRHEVIEVDVVRHVQVEITIAVVVEESAAGAECLYSDYSGAPRDIYEAPICPILVQPVAAVVGHVDVRVPVVVVIGDGATHPPTGVAKARCCCGVRKHRAVVAVEGVARTIRAGRPFDRRPVQHVQVQVSVPIVVEEGRAPHEGIDHVLLFAITGDVHCGDADLCRDIDKLHARV